MKRVLIGIVVGVLGKMAWDRYGYLVVGGCKKGAEKMDEFLKEKEKELQDKTQTTPPEDVKFEEVD